MRTGRRSIVEKDEDDEEEGEEEEEEEEADEEEESDSRDDCKLITRRENSRTKCPEKGNKPNKVSRYPACNQVTFHLLILITRVSNT